MNIYIAVMPFTGDALKFGKSIRNLFHFVGGVNEKDAKERAEKNYGRISTILPIDEKFFDTKIYKQIFSCATYNDIALPILNPSRSIFASLIDE